MIKVFIMTRDPVTSGVQEVLNPYEIKEHFAFPFELETKLIQWYKARFIKANSDWTSAWFEAHEFSGSKMSFEAWVSAITSAA